MKKIRIIFPVNLISLYAQEEQLYNIALGIISDDTNMQLHASAVESAMDIADVFRRFDTNDEDLKVIQILGMRTFNAFGASLKLTLSGYFQNSALVMRDILETVFLLDLFRTDRTLIKKWRLADKKDRKRDFSPLKVREALDSRDGLTSKKRFEKYELFSELAGHPNMKSSLMMRPHKDGDAVIGLFMEKSSLEATISEMGHLAIQAGEIIPDFYPNNWLIGLPTRLSFAAIKNRWITTFYSGAISS